MADHQRIHPAPDPEAPPPSPPQSAPLFPPNTLKSDSVGRHDRVSDHDHYYPPPPTRTHPVSYAPPPRKRSKRCTCCRVFCCFFALLLILLIAIAATGGILYLIFRPKIPNYSIDTLRVTQFNVANNNSITATFAVNITAHNPNDHIGIYYLHGSTLSASYEDTPLCEGGLPVFYQGHRNTTVMDVELTGTVNDATGFRSRLQQQVTQTGNVPLVLTGRIPIKVKLGRLKLMKMKFKVRCELSIDNLASNSQVRIGNSSCKIRLKKIF